MRCFSFDATMRSNVTVGPPIELLLYKNDSFSLDTYRKFRDKDPELETIHALWERSFAECRRRPAGS